MTVETVSLDKEAANHAMLISDIYTELISRGLAATPQNLYRVVCVLKNPLWHWLLRKQSSYLPND